MKYFILFFGLFMPAFIHAQALFTWDLMYAGSWEESKTLNNRLDLRFNFTGPALLVRAQALDRHTVNFELDPVWGDPAKGITSCSLGLYHRTDSSQTTDSRFLYGVLDEWGLSARIRSPWIRSAPYAENHKPILADLRTTTSASKKDELYLYLSSPRFSLNPFGLDILLRGFASGQFTPANSTDTGPAPAFAGGAEAVIGKKTNLLIECFFTGFKLPAKEPDTWFSDPPPLPVRDFRLEAVSLMLNIPWLSVTSDWAWSQTFAYGKGVYGNLGLRVNPPFFSAWSLSLTADGMSERYTGRDGGNPGGGFRTAWKLERKGAHSSFFRVNNSFRGSTVGEPFERSSIGLYYRFPSSSPNVAGTKGFPLRISRIALNADRNASDLKKINDGIDGSLGLSLNLPPLLLPKYLLSASAVKVKNLKPKVYPLNINLTESIDWLGRSDEQPSPFPFSSPVDFNSAKTACELLWSPGILQFRTRWGYTVYAGKDNLWEASIGASARFKHGSFSVKFAWPAFPEKWNCTLAWRAEK